MIPEIGKWLERGFLGSKLNLRRFLGYDMISPSHQHSKVIHQLSMCRNVCPNMLRHLDPWYHGITMTP